MNKPSRLWPLVLLCLFILSGTSAQAADDEAAWAATPPRLSFIDGEVSYWRQGAEEWAAAPINLPLAEGDSLYTGRDANFEVQFGSRSFVRADENSQLTYVVQDEGRIQFKVTGGLVSFDMRRLSAGSRVEMSTPDAVFVIEDPGYYRVEVESNDTHFITRHGGQARVTTADGRSLSINPSEDIVVTAGNPVNVATYAAPAPDVWDRWNDERTDRIGESISARYLPPDVYGAEELDHFGYWRVVATYGAVWIPYGVSATWVPYSTGYWVWDPYYEWTWVDDAPWGWAPFHYGRWVVIDGYWAWVPGPVVSHSVYSPALVGFMVAGSGVTVNVNIGLPGLWWVALGWGEPVIPWWHHHRHHGKPRWDGWGGPRIVNDRELRDRSFANVAEIRYHNADVPHAILTVPPDKFGRERLRVTEENRYRPRDFAPVQGELPIKPSRASLYGGAPKGIQPPREIVSRPVVSTRTPRQPMAQPWQAQPPRATPEKLPEVIYMVPPVQRYEGRDSLPRPPYGSEAGPEVSPPPQPRRYGDVKRSVPSSVPATSITPEPATRTRPAPAMRPETGPVIRTQPAPAGRPETAPVIRPQPAPAERSKPEPVPRVQPLRRDQETSRPPLQQPPRGDIRQEQLKQQRPLPGRPANQPHQKRVAD